MASPGLLFVRDRRTLGELPVGLPEESNCLRECKAREVGLREQAAGGFLEMTALIGGVGLGQMRADEGAASSLGFDVALGFKFVVGLLDRQRRDHKLFAELAVGSEAITGLQPSAGNGFDDLPHDLAVDGKLVGGVDDELHYK